jgi:hypothetical protein
MNEKDNPCSLAKVFSRFQTRETWFKKHSRIRIATIYIFHTHAHFDLRVWHFLLRSLCWLYNICNASMFSLPFLPEIHISF